MIICIYILCCTFHKYSWFIFIISIFSITLYFPFREVQEAVSPKLSLLITALLPLPPLPHFPENNFT